MKIHAIYERVPLNRSFLSHKVICDNYPFMWHCHQNYELFVPLRGGGHYVIGNRSGVFKPFDVLLAGPEQPHAFYSFKHGKKAFEFIKIHFEQRIAEALLKNFSEMRVLEDWFKNAVSGIVYHMKNSDKLSSIFVKIHRLQEKDSSTAFCLFISLLLKLMDLYDQKRVEDVKCASLENFDARRMDKICKYIHNSFTRKITLNEIAKHVNMSIPALCAFFKKSSNTSIIEYVNRLRIEKACMLLVSGNDSILEIAHSSGYETLSHFNKIFKRICGITPKEYRKTQRNLY